MGGVITLALGALIGIGLYWHLNLHGVDSLDVQNELRLMGYPCDKYWGAHKYFFGEGIYAYCYDSGIFFLDQNRLRFQIE